MANKKPKAIVSSIEIEDIITDILLRLPRKSIARFNLVSKQWHNIICSTSFTHNYSKNLSLLGFFANTVDRSSFAPVDEKIPDRYLPSGFDHFDRLSVYSIQSSNGLVLYYATDINYIVGEYTIHVFPKQEKHIKEYYFVHNPFKDQYVLLPQLPRVQSTVVYSFVKGFVFDQSSNPPRLIVTEVSKPERGVLVVNYFSSYDCIWSTNSHNFDHIFDPGVEENLMLYGPSTFLNNKLHWVSCMSCIFAYDVNEGQFTVFKGPVDGHIFGEGTGHGYGGGVYLGEVKHNLVFIQFSYTGVQSCDVTLWTLSDYSRADWTCGYRIVINNMPEQHDSVFWPLVALDRNNTRIMYLNLGKKLYSYNHEAREFMELYKVYVHDLIDMTYRFYIPYELPNSPMSILFRHYFSALFPYDPSIGWDELSDVLRIVATHQIPVPQPPVNTWHGYAFEGMHRMNNRYSSVVDYANRLIGSMVQYFHPYLVAIGRSNLPAEYPVGQQDPSFLQINNHPAATHQTSYPSNMHTQDIGTHNQILANPELPCQYPINWDYPSDVAQGVGYHANVPNNSHSIQQADYYFASYQLPPY